MDWRPVIWWWQKLHNAIMDIFWPPPSPVWCLYSLPLIYWHNVEKNHSLPSLPALRKLQSSLLTLDVYKKKFLSKHPTDLQNNLIETIVESEVQDNDGTQQQGHSSLSTPSPYIRHHLQISWFRLILLYLELILSIGSLERKITRPQFRFKILFIIEMQ